MTIIRVGLHHGKSKTIEIDKPYNEIRADDIWAKDIHGITGWVDVEEETRQSRKQLYEQSGRIDELKANNRQLKHKLGACKAVDMGQKNTIAALRADAKSRDKIIHNLNYENDDLCDEANRLTNEIVRLNNIVVEKENSIEELRNDDLKKMYYPDQKKIEELQRELDECKMNVNIIRDKNKIIGEYRTALDEYETTIEDLKTTIKTNNEVSHADMDRKDGWIEELRKERDNCKESVAEKSSLIDELENAANKEWSLIKRIDEEIARRGDRMLYERDAIIKRQKNTIQSDSRTIVEQMQKIEDQRKMLADYEKTIQRLIDSNKDDRSIVDDMNKTIRDQKATINELKVSGDQRTIHLQKMRIDEQKETILRLVKEVKELRDADDFRRKIRDQDNIIERLEKNLHDTNTALDESRKIAREYHKKFTDCGKQLKMEIATVDHLDVMLTEERKDNNDWLWNKYNQLTRMVLESNLTVLGKDQTIARLERRLDKCMTHLSEYDAALKDRDKIIDEQKAVVDEKSVRNDDLILDNKIQAAEDAIEASADEVGI